MTLEGARQYLVEAGYRIRKEERLGNNTGTRLRLDGGAIVDVFDNGNYSCQGKKCEIVEGLLDRGLASTPDIIRTST
jgi:predicted nucleotide-binding protein